MFKHGSVPFVSGSLVALLLAGPVFAEEVELRSWAAPPYWAPPAGASVAPGGRSAEGRQALAAGPAALPFISLFPCRLVDTRAPAFPAPLGGGFLPPATVRSYTLAGVCNVPATAQAISLNVTVVNPTGPGFITLWPEGGAFPPVSTLNYLGLDVIVNAAVVPLSATGGISIALGVSGGDVILDTNGYYARTPAVTSVNTLIGDVALSAGTNVTITPSGNTLTIASTGGGGGPPIGAAGGDLSGSYPNPGVAAVGGSPAPAVHAAEVAANGATMANSPNAIVRRDAAGNFSAGLITANLAGVAFSNVLRAGDTMTGSLTLSPGNIHLDDSTAGTGNVIKGGIVFIHATGLGNAFFGKAAGSLGASGTGNTGLGEVALAGVTTGGANTAVGWAALTANTTGFQNSALGNSALSANTTGLNNTSIGFNSLHSNTTGSENTATGVAALFANVSGTSNTAIGGEALENNTGDWNTAVGRIALTGNTTGSSNVAIGGGADQSNQTGNGNTAVGVSSLQVSTSGSNTAIGYRSLFNETSGFQNTAIGYLAGARDYPFPRYTDASPFASVPITTGNYNTFVGHAAGSTANVSNCTAVGIDAYCDLDNQVRLGNTFVTSIGGKVGWSALSDARAKSDIRDLDRGLELVRKLRPVTYRLKTGDGRTDMGFVAQDVEDLLGESYGVLGVGGDPDRTLTLRYQDFIAPLVRAVQEQQSIIESDRTEIRDLQARLARLEKILSIR